LALTIDQIWRQNDIPVVYKPEFGEIMVKAPYSVDNKAWFSSGRRSRPKYDPKYRCWHLPRSAFDEIVTRFLYRFKTLYIIQPHREKEICAPACWNAEGNDCECSCMGVHHGEGVVGRWFVVSEALAVQWGNKKLHWRLLVEKKRTG
jgi:hypothetical protein